MKDLSELLLPDAEADDRVVVLVPGRPSPPTVAGKPSRRTGVPSRGEVGLRKLVRILSETGFVVLREKKLRTGGPVLKAVVARPDPFRIRGYREGDEAAILRLFARSFHVERSLDHWRWKYLENPWGGGLISQAFSPEGELASHYAGYPVPFWRRDRRGAPSFLALHMGDTMTDPAFRDVGRGRTALLARAVRHFFARHRGDRFGFFYGFNTGPIQRFCGWFIGGSQVEPVRFWRRELDADPGWTRRGYRVERVERFDRAWDRFFRRVAPHYRFLVERDARYLDWRYRRAPDGGFVVLAARRWGRLVGWSVFKLREGRILWGDALFAPGHAQAASALLAAALDEPELRGAKGVDAWFSERPAWWNERLRQLGFVAGPHPQDLGFMALPDTEPAAIEELRELYYTMGDGDLF